MKRGIFLVIVLALLMLSCVSAIKVVGTCTDTDAGEDYYFVKGSVTKISMSYQDYCSGSVLYERVCLDDGTVSTEQYTCEYGCEDGACLTEAPSECDWVSEDQWVCNLDTKQVCQEGDIWTTSLSEESYCSYCADQDSSCGEEVCSVGACDYVNQVYCYDSDGDGEGVWMDDYFCNGWDKSDSYPYCGIYCDDVTASGDEVCNDYLDNDADGEIDCLDNDCSESEFCECTYGSTQECGSEEGVCTIGEQSCVVEEGSTYGYWGDCSGIEASTEYCDGEDNDCDGSIDEGCTCEPGTIADCGTDVGLCNAGVQICQDDGSWSVCFGVSYQTASIEECDGYDNDCDGEVDEGCGCTEGASQECGTDVGVCIKGVQNCVNGTWSDCEGDIEAVAEICGDTLDNDCDGKTDYDDEACAESSDLMGEAQEATEESTRGETSEDVEEEVKDEDEVSEDTSGSDTQEYNFVESEDEEEEEGGSFIFFVIPIVLVLLGGIGFVLYKQGLIKLSGSKPVQPSFGKPVQQSKPAVQSKPVQQSKPVLSGFKSKLDSQLEKSFSKSKEMFGKR